MANNLTKEQIDNLTDEEIEQIFSERADMIYPKTDFNERQFQDHIDDCQRREHGEQWGARDAAYLNAMNEDAEIRSKLAVNARLRDRSAARLEKIQKEIDDFVERKHKEMVAQQEVSRKARGAIYSLGGKRKQLREDLIATMSQLPNPAGRRRDATVSPICETDGCTNFRQRARMARAGYREYHSKCTACRKGKPVV